MRKALRLALPSGGALLLRVSQLLILVGIGNLARGDEQQILIASFGIIAAVGVVADSGAANYLLTVNSSHLNRTTVFRTVLVHSAIASAGSAVAVTYSALVLGATEDWILLLVSALALTQSLDAAVRAARAPLLAGGSDIRFATTDILLGFYKSFVVMAAVVWAEILILLALPLGSLLVLAVVLVENLRKLDPGDAPPHFLRSLLTFGASGGASALYSQAPILIGGFFLSIEAVASLALAYRIVQPLEILPATLMQQAMPRLRLGRIRVWQLTCLFASLGATLCMALILGLPVIERILSTALTPPAIFFVLCASLPVKFANYALTAGTFVSGLVGKKLQITLLVGVFAVCLAVIFSVLAAPALVAVATLASEVLLSTCLIITLVRWNRRAGK